MIDEKILKHEIENRIKSLERNIGYGIGVDAQINAYESLLTFINSMQKEKLSNARRT